MRLKLDESKAHASELRGRPDLLWYQLLSSAATWVTREVLQAYAATLRPSRRPHIEYSRH